MGGIRVDRLWTIGGTVVAAALIALTWFFLINPQRAETAELEGQASSTEIRLATLQQRLVELREQNLTLDEYQAQLARDRQALPETAGLSDFLRELQVAGAQTSVVVSGVSIGAAVEVTGTKTKIFALPISLVADGTAGNLQLFLEELQQKQPRAVLVSNVNAVPEGTSRSLDETVTMTMGLQAYVAPPSPSGSGSASPKPAPTAGPSGSSSPVPDSSPSVVSPPSTGSSSLVSVSPSASRSPSVTTSRPAEPT